MRPRRTVRSLIAVAASVAAAVVLAGPAHAYNDVAVKIDPLGWDIEGDVVLAQPIRACLADASNACDRPGTYYVTQQRQRFSVKAGGGPQEVFSRRWNIPDWYYVFIENAVATARSDGATVSYPVAKAYLDIYDPPVGQMYATDTSSNTAPDPRDGVRLQAALAKRGSDSYELKFFPPRGFEGVSDARAKKWKPLITTPGKAGPLPTLADPETALTDRLPCTITGTPDDDVINGTDGPDVICGLGGNDTIDGRGGDDVIYGGAGDDVIDAGAGDDIVGGGSDDDAIDGGSGDDYLKGATGEDDLDGSQGTDHLDGGTGDDAFIVAPAGRTSIEEFLLPAGGSTILSGPEDALGRQLPRDPIYKSVNGRLVFQEDSDGVPAAWSGVDGTWVDPLDPGRDRLY